jgi:hypothetical protein
MGAIVENGMISGDGDARIVGGVSFQRIVLVDKIAPL